MQSRQATESAVTEQLSAAANRVSMIGRVHSRLHVLDHIDHVELGGYLTDLCHDISGLFTSGDARDPVSVRALSVDVPTRIGVPLGFIVSELVTNAAKYSDGKIEVTLAEHPDGGFALSVVDDGPGLPAEFDPAKSSGLGMKIVSALTKQIGGRIVFGLRSPERGAYFTILFA